MEFGWPADPDDPGEADQPPDPELEDPDELVDDEPFEPVPSAVDLVEDDPAEVDAAVPAERAAIDPARPRNAAALRTPAATRERFATWRRLWGRGPGGDAIEPAGGDGGGNRRAPRAAGSSHEEQCVGSMSSPRLVECMRGSLEGAHEAPVPATCALPVKPGGSREPRPAGGPSLHSSPMSTETGGPPRIETTDPPPPDPTAVRPGRGERHRRKGSRVRRWVLVGAGAFLLLLAAATIDAYWQAYRAVDDLKQVASGLSAARTSLADGHMPNGDPFATALADTERIREDLAHARPTFGMIGAVPFLGRPVVAVRQLAIASEDEARAAVSARDLIDEMSGGAFTASEGGGRGDHTKCADEPTRAAKRACKQARDRGEQDGTPGTQSPVYSDGSFDLQAIAAFRPRVRQVVDQLEAAEDAVRAVPTAPFISKATQLKEDLLDQVSQAVRVGRSALTGMELLPQLFGADGPRRYFVAFGDLSYLRGAGGSTLAYAILTADDGRLQISQSKEVFRNLDDQTNVPIRVPKDNWYLGGPDPLQRQIRLGNANYSPNFPSSAIVMARIYERLTGEHLDGVIQVDALAVADMLKAVGPLDVPLWDGRVNSSNVARIAYIDSHLQYPRGPQRKELSAQLVEQAWNRIGNPADGAQLLSSAVQLGRALSTKDLQVWFADPGEQRLAERLGWTGRIRPADGDYLLVAEDARSTDALSFFSKTTIVHQVKVQSNGDLEVRTVLRQRVDVPPIDRQLPIVNKQGSDRSTLFNVYLPDDAKLDFVARDTGASHFLVRNAQIHHEAGTEVVSAVMSSPPELPTDLVVVYTIPHGIVESNGHRVLRLTVQMQPKVIPDDLAMVVTLPGGMHFGVVPKPFVVDGNVLRYTRTVDRDFSVDIPLSS